MMRRQTKSAMPAPGAQAGALRHRFGVLQPHVNGGHRLTESARGPMVGWHSQAPGSLPLVRSARWIGIHTMARTSFSPPEARIVVSSDGYFDVYPSTARSNGDKPAYRGVLAELGQGIRGTDDRLAVRPNSVALADAVTAWSAVNGAAALGGELGRGRDGAEPKA